MNEILSRDFDIENSIIIHWCVIKQVKILKVRNGLIRRQSNII